MMQLQSLAGLVAIPLIAWALTEERDKLNPDRTFRFVMICIGFQLGLAAILLYVPGTRVLFWLVSQAVVALQEATDQGLRVVFGYLSGGPQPYEVKNPSLTYIFAFRGLPLILVMSVVSRLLFLWGVLPKMIKGMAWALQKTLGISGPLGIASAANIFVGMVEAPLLVRPYLRGMSRGALFATMTVGMSTVAGTVMALYASLLAPSLPGAAGHILVASLISVPAALMVSWLMVPSGFDTGPEEAEFELPEEERNVMDAIAQGTLDGLKLMVFVASMLVVMVALVSLINLALGWFAGVFGFELSFEKIVGWVCAPLAWLVGIPLEEIWAAGSIIGIKVVLNELLAYLQLAQIPAEIISDRSRLILTYALCGFANFGSLGIMTGGLIAMIPERRDDIFSLGPKTIISGMLATLMTGAVVGLLTPG